MEEEIEAFFDEDKYWEPCSSHSETVNRVPNEESTNVQLHLNKAASCSKVVFEALTLMINV
jgi:hypothetical protein